MQNSSMMLLENLPMHMMLLLLSMRQSKDFARPRFLSIDGSHSFTLGFE
jgi:hypothetical protein